MMYHVISDTHFYHANIIKYCSRPFADVLEMNETMVERWNKVVKPADTIIHVGDFAFGKKENIGEIRKKLNGRIVLIRGNHDRKHKYMLEEGIDEVHDRFILPVCGDEILFEHRPRIGTRKQLFHVYGHVHNVPHKVPLDAWNACVEVNDYTPRPLDFVYELLKTKGRG